MKVSVQHKICLISSRIKIKTPTRVEHLQISSELDSSQQIRLPEINIDCSDCSDCSSQSIHQKQKQKKNSHLSSAGICKRKTRRGHKSFKQSSVLGFGSRNVNVPPAAKYRQTELDYHNTPIVSCSAYTSVHYYTMSMCAQ